MMREGVGKCAPSPVVVNISAKEWSELADEAVRRAQHRQYGEGQSPWKVGLTGLCENPHGGESLHGSAAAVLIGMLGEYAVTRWCRAAGSVDFTLHDGDGGVDLRLFGIPLQVKTRRTKKCVIRLSEFSLSQRLKRYVAYVFCEIGGEAPGDVSLLGWQHASTKDYRVEDSRFGHKNVVIDDKDLLPMSRLVAFCKARRTAC